MKYPKFTAAVAALAVVTLAGCAPGPDPQTGAAPSSTTQSKSALKEYERSIERELDRNGAVGLPAGVKRAYAEAAAQDGVPFAFAYDNRPGDGTCTWLRLPNRTLWSLNTGGALSRDTHAENLFREHPGAAVALLCDEQPAPVGLDIGAADAASTSGAPYRWTDGCKTFVRVPGSSTDYWVPDKLTVSGTTLGTEVDQSACVDTPLPGQTKGGN